LTWSKAQIADEDVPCPFAARANPDEMKGKAKWWQGIGTIAKPMA
jgi:hypothetical protein